MIALRPIDWDWNRRLTRRSRSEDIMSYIETQMVPSDITRSVRRRNLKLSFLSLL
jgi:hypothetical protein